MKAKQIYEQRYSKRHNSNYDKSNNPRYTRNIWNKFYLIMCEEYKQRRIKQGTVIVLHSLVGKSHYKRRTFRILRSSKHKKWSTC